MTINPKTLFLIFYKILFAFFMWSDCLLGVGLVFWVLGRCVCGVLGDFCTVTLLAIYGSSVGSLVP